MITAYKKKRIYLETLTFAYFAKRAVAIARAKQLIEKQLAHTITAKNVKKIKINQNCRFVQKEKMISIKKYRKMIDTKQVKKNRLKLNRKIKYIRQRHGQ